MKRQRVDSLASEELSSQRQVENVVPDDCSVSNQVEFFDDSIEMLDADDKILGELSQEFLENDDNVIDELSQDFVEASQFFEGLPLYYRIGSGFEQKRPGPFSVGPAFIKVKSDDILNVKDAIILVEKSRRPNKKYNAEEIIFKARIDQDRLPQNLRNAPVASVVDSVRELFNLIIQRSREGLSSTDLIRLCLQADQLDKPISTTLMPVGDLTPEKMMAAVMKVVQSKKNIALDEGFTVDVITLKRDIGAGRGRKVVNVEVDRLKKQSVLTIPSDDSGLCCAKAIVYALAHLEKDERLIASLRRRNRPALLNRGRELHAAAGVPLGPCTYSEIAQFEQHLNVQIAVVALEHGNTVAYKGQKRSRRVNLWLHNNHFDVVKSLKGFFASNHYCETCEKPYNNLEDHRCPQACHICLKLECPLGEQIRCQNCDRLCQSKECFEAHKAVTGQQQLSLCDRIYQCQKCCCIIRRREVPRDQHRCWTVKCSSCSKYVVISEHQCFLQKVEPKKPIEHFIFFDFETDQSSGEHIVNFALAQDEEGREKIFKGYDACAQFCTWLFQPEHKGITAIAHNMKGFDGQFIMEWLLAQGSTPEVIPNGSMLLTIFHKTLGIRVIDSLNFFPMPLAKLPACFGFTELKKGYFPHLFNIPRNQTYVGLMPEIVHYSPDTMSPSARTLFMAWFEEHKNDEFNFQQEMETYCRSDVDILRRCCMEFRNLLLEISGLDPFNYVTIASCCMGVYRTKHMSSNSIALVPCHGYNSRINYSPDSIRWLDFIAAKSNIRIKHALNGKGEHKIDGISVDGYCDETKTVYQFQGCFYHGCPQCYDGDIKNPLKNDTMGNLLHKTQETTAKLRSRGYAVVEKWEHEFTKEKKENPELKEFLNGHEIQDRLDPRNAFFGGRTNALRLFYEGNAKYVDFTSLYPWVNKYCLYPTGHPQIITENFASISDYFGFVLCKILPPRGLYLPVLPAKANGKLMFPLCGLCALNLQQSPCHHTDEERCLQGTWVTEEVKLALTKGYKLVKIYEIYHFPQTSDKLFQPYTDTFLKIKQESSGWPAECVSDEQRARYVQEYREHEGIQLEPDKIEFNPGKRQVAKLCLNSLWGRFGMNLNKDRLSYVNTLPQFNQMLTDPTKNVKNVYLPSAEVAAIQWQTPKEFQSQDTSTNIFIAAFTTAWARIKLYKSMDKLGSNVLYHDTDSIVYSTEGTTDLPRGHFLGELTDELDGDVITTFVSGGPKNYAYQTSRGKTCCKVRGFTLNFKNAQQLNFETMKSLICSMDEEMEPVALHNAAKICRDTKRRKVVNKSETKLYRIVYDKRVIQSDLSTLPYGY